MINKHVTIEWLIELIRSGNTAPFYNTREWYELRELKKKMNTTNVNAAEQEEYTPKATRYTTCSIFAYILSWRLTTAILNCFAGIVTTKNITKRSS